MRAITRNVGSSSSTTTMRAAVKLWRSGESSISPSTSVSARPAGFGSNQISRGDVVIGPPWTRRMNGAGGLERAAARLPVRAAALDVWPNRPVQEVSAGQYDPSLPRIGETGNQQIGIRVSEQ